MIRHCAEVALSSVCRPVVVVIGAHGGKVREALAGLPITIVVNDRWAEGMGTSIQAGLAAAMERPVSGVILTLADQPRLTAATFDRLVDCHRAQRAKRVASAYEGTVGVPALFGRELFADLMALEPSMGCKGILLAQGDARVSLPCPEAADDVDTPADYQRLRPAGDAE